MRKTTIVGALALAGMLASSHAQAQNFGAAPGNFGSLPNFGTPTGGLTFGSPASAAIAGGSVAVAGVGPGSAIVEAGGVARGFVPVEAGSGPVVADQFSVTRGVAEGNAAFIGAGSSLGIATLGFANGALTSIPGLPR